ncbi:MAG: hypothetical protein DRN27_03785 [Thermoplasmata archaeon]|nr:MAG: hypothetical protein DRN27_03785 [Thermoplasmata archaeon]
MDDINTKDNIYYQDYNEIGQKKQDSKPLIAGIILMIAGIMGMLTWIAALSFDMSMIDISMLETQDMTITTNQLQSMIQICATIGVILSVFPLLGGILTIQKKLWGGALACSIIGLFSIGPIFLSSILSLVALILLVMSKEQFITKSEDIIDDY